MTPTFVSAHQRATRTLLNEISTGRLRPGEKLNEVNLAERLEVSRNTLREAFVSLEDYGVVVRLPHRGVWVTLPDEELIDEIFRLRSLLEPAVLQWSRGLDIDALHECVQDGQLAREAHDHDAVGDANQRFHAVIVEAAGSTFADEIMTRVLAMMRLLFVHASDEHQEFHYPYVERNEEILKLVESGQREQAAETMREYLEKSRSQLQELLNGPAIPEDSPSAETEVAVDGADEVEEASS
ncbi:GntR family transcriptional regulator [Brevibacterium sp. UMB1308A]|uniref:GntR family transcriptional regulator n=1 Tax=Brevibacterium sp. UMB1308A TaxID=3050608 RepID=UPI0025500480|nr:GntR family transcriptional regulator [Brevibacterium sp. UMB1308A]MDK8345616.1 GntR family transcriptional regulator [Brevibacterium sp. UMB1308B]MDK8713220.1 GntR family transcriptional regulator [Brevibacterium sp. UMB1308A]